MVGYFIVQLWNNNRTIFKHSITEQDIQHAIQRRETIINIPKREYYDTDLKRWIPTMLQ